MTHPEKKYEYDKAYLKNATLQVPFRLNRKLDADIIEWLEKQPNKAGYLKQLIRRDIETAKEEK